MSVIALVIIGGALAWNLYSRENATADTLANSNNQLIVETATTSNSFEALEKDSDGDGLKDWEEILWGSNSQSSDSDGDGMTDEKEVASGRNPVIKGTGAAGANSSTTISANLTETDKFGRELFTQYMQMRQSGTASDPASQEIFIQNLLKSGTLSQSAKRYTDSDLVLITTPTNLLRKIYGNTVGSIFLSYSVKGRSEPVIIKDSLDYNNSEILDELDPIIASYRTILTKLLKVTVPSDAVDIHIELVNTMSAALFIAESLKKINTDPILTLQSLAQYQAVTQSLIDGFNHMKEYLMDEGILYEDSEGGALFNPKF